MNVIGNSLGLLMLSWCFTSGESASVNVTLFPQNVQNGAAITLTAAFDPTFGDPALEDLKCEYTDPTRSGPTRITKLNRIARQIVLPTPASPDAVRWSLTSSGNPMVLVISPVTFSDEKRQFYCILQYYNATTLLSITSANYMVENVYSKAVLSEAGSIQPSKLITEGDPARLKCIATGRPAPTIIWQYNSAINGTVSNTSVGSPLITVTSVLTIQHPSPALHNQNITCFVSHQFTSTMNRTTSIIMNYVPFQVELKASSSAPVNGSSVTLTCTARSEGSPSFRFLLVNGSSSVIVQDGISATYTTLPLDYKNYNNYKATFQCISYNRIGESPPQTLVLDIQVRPEISTLSAIAAVEGQDVVLTCKIIAANPAARVIWRNPIGTEISTANGTVLLPSINRRQHGEYLCLAANGIGSVASKATNLLVNYGAELMQSNEERLGCIGDTVSIKCNAVGRPTPDIFLYLNGTLLKRALSNLSYSFALDSERQFGVYTCISNNTFGTSNITTTFNMKCIKSNANRGIVGGSVGGIIGGIVGGICFLVIILLVGIFVAKKHRQSSAGFEVEDSSGNAIRGIGADITNFAAIELEKLGGTYYMGPDGSVFPSAKDNSDNYNGLVPVSEDPINAKKKIAMVN